MASRPEMNARRQTVRDLVDEAKKRAILLLMCAFGLSYLMSLTSSSVWVNFPAAAILIIFARYISLDLDAKRRAAACNKLSQVDQSPQKRSVDLHILPPEKSNWRRKVNSLVVETAIDQFTRHLVSEWVTDLWYSRVTPDRDGPDELVQIMNVVLGEISRRARDINLIDLFVRDVINLCCNHLELYRLGQFKIGKQELTKLSIVQRDKQLRIVLASEAKLHPALFSLEAEHKVLQHLMSGLISLTFKPEDLHCTFFRYTVRELLACAVIRPVINLANPRFINEKIESLVLSFANKANKGVAPSAEEVPFSKPNGPPRPSADQVVGFLDHSTAGVELVQLRDDCSKISSEKQTIKNRNGIVKDTNISHANLGVHDASLVDMDNKYSPLKSKSGPHNARLSYSGNSGPSDSRDNHEKKIETCNSGTEWAQMLDIISKKKTQALAPEHFENMWTKGRNYRKKEDVNQVAKQFAQNKFLGFNDTSQHPIVEADNRIQDGTVNSDIHQRNTASSHHQCRYPVKGLHSHIDLNAPSHQESTSHPERTEHFDQQEFELDSESSNPTEDDEANNVTGLGSPGTRVWDSKNKANATISSIRHPLEPSEFRLTEKSKKGHIRHPRTLRTTTGRKRSRSSSQKTPIWQEVERTSYLLGDGQDILHAAEKDPKAEELSDDLEVESWGRIHSGTAASSSMSSISVSGSCNSSLKSPEDSVLADSFLKLRCEVLGANIVKSGSVTFAVYSIAVTDANNNSWSIKRRFRHFEELHRRLKEFPVYNLNLPPKHFLSSGLDVTVIQERCKLLDKFLKNLLQLPTISGSIEVWDFLSVDSQTYMFSDSLSIIQTLSVDLDEKSSEKSMKFQNFVEDNLENSPISGENSIYVGKDYAVQKNRYGAKSDELRLRRSIEQNMGTTGTKEHKIPCQDNLGNDSENRMHNNGVHLSISDSPKKVKLSGSSMQAESQILETTSDTTIPTEWVPPNLSIHLWNLVDVIFQLHDGGWIRRQTFWVAKQLLQLGMGDAFDDWLLEKIQLLRRGVVIASAINRIEQMLWPDGIFLTKHPNRKPQTPVSSPGSQKNGTNENTVTSEQQLEAARRAQFVHELIIDKAPAALVSLIGRKEYEQSAEDIYFFLQSPVFLKQLAFELLELILLAAFPELDDAIRLLHEKKEQFGAVEDDR